MTGIYFMELCLAGLFFLVRDADGNATCTPQAIITIVTVAFTALFHFSLVHRSGLHWLSSRPIFKQLMAQTGSKDFVFGTADVLRIAREAEEKTAAKQPGGRPRKLLIEEVEEEEDEKEVVSDSTNSESEGSVIVVRTTQSRAN
ncbi:hypothetical protein V501_01143 [Pseudogymnoascus sp. VKM F-4519 (FW-2642)]|nr:hypothetical protein V501_01143 [Pseudogymnoascus sp. VKM F-4519 (FW-2642)]